MAKTIGIGYQDFEKLITDDIFYVDKTKFIKEWWENKDEVTLITRPRRFGKTLNLSMLEKFFSVKYAGRGDLFENLSIWEEEEYRKMQGSYPVIFLSFAKVKNISFQSARKSVSLLITRLYKEYDFLLDGDLLDAREKTMFREMSAYMDDSVEYD